MRGIAFQSLYLGKVICHTTQYLSGNGAPTTFPHACFPNRRLHAEGQRMESYISASNLPLQRVLPVATTICGGFQRRTQRPAAAPSSRGIADLAVESATESKDRVSVSRANLPLLPESALPTATLSASQPSNSLSRRQRACVGITVPRLRIRSSLACASKVATLVRKERPRVTV